ncbi:MAG: histidinol-phosphatase HisJ family protein [Ruminococcaceae bacterium]|nr:histidinol-phosphatase HisJ family protein [Oscillospiraceae bacterium]
MIKCNYHTHTILCDGKDTAEEIITEAIDRGFETIGFSAHSPLNGESWCLLPDTKEYRETISTLKEKYKGKIEILCGIEQDYYSEVENGYDYVIGSVHCVKVQDKLIAVDDTADIVINAIDRYFGGDADAFAEEYFRTVSDVVAKTGADIIGHLDLIMKFSEKTNIFNPESERYKKASEDAVKKLCKSNALFEINTGAMARGLRTSPYPAENLLRLICSLGGDIIINSDCHDKRYLDHWFDEAVKLAKDCGFKRIAYITKGEIRYQNI